MFGDVYKVRNHDIPALSLWSPKVWTHSLLSSSAAEKLTHLSPHCSTDIDTDMLTQVSSPQVLGRPLLPGQLVRFAVVLLPPAAATAAFAPLNGLYSRCEPMSWSRYGVFTKKTHLKTAQRSSAGKERGETTGTAQ